MPPQKRIFREDILEAAADLVRQEGPAALSVRNIAKKLGCSTQPVYSEFENMETLREELTARVRERCLREDAGSYKQVALSFLQFARREKNLFQLVYLRRRVEVDLPTERLNRAYPEQVPTKVLRTLFSYYIANRPEDSDWVVLPVMNFDCYFGDTKFGRKYLAMLPDEVIQRSSSFGVSRYQEEQEKIASTESAVRNIFATNALMETAISSTSDSTTENASR